jgi:hypothetical protein
MIRKLITTAALCGVLSFPAAASARMDPTDIAAFVNAAQSYWGQAAPCGAPTISYVPAITPAMEAQGVQANSQAYVLPNTCTITLLQSAWTRWQIRDTYSAYAVSCRLIAHEYSHLLNLWDTTTSTPSMLNHEISPTLPDRPCDVLERSALDGF